MGDFIGHIVSSAVAGIAALIGLYVSYRQLQQREWFRAEMTKVVTENCAGKVQFEAHVEADTVFQETVISKIDTGKQTGDALIEAKMATVNAQVVAVCQRVDHLTTVMEKRLL